MSVRERILEFKHKKNLNQSDIARLSGIPQPTYNKYEKGERPFPLESILKIADALEVNPIELLRDECRLTDEDVNSKLQLISTKQKEIKESDQLIEAALHLNTSIKELGDSLTDKEAETLSSMLELCIETLKNEVKKDTDIKSAKTA